MKMTKIAQHQSGLVDRTLSMSLFGFGWWHFQKVQFAAYSSFARLGVGNRFTSANFIYVQLATISKELS
jgi:hypothetical protein